MSRRKTNKSQKTDYDLRPAMFYRVPDDKSMPKNLLKRFDIFCYLLSGEADDLDDYYRLPTKEDYRPWWENNREFILDFIKEHKKPGDYHYSLVRDITTPWAQKYFDGE